jgi:hypothetical protein
MSRTRVYAAHIYPIAAETLCSRSTVAKVYAGELTTLSSHERVRLAALKLGLPAPPGWREGVPTKHPAN